MPQMDWRVFQDAHHRPHLVVGHLSNDVSPTEGRSEFELIVSALGAFGNYAITEIEADVYAVFEEAADVERFTKLFAAKSSVRDEAWATRTTVNFDKQVRKRLAATLKR